MTHPPPESGHRHVDQIVAGHFRESAGYRVWRSRGTRDWLLILTVSGQGRFGYDGGAFIAEPGDLVLVQPHARHDYGVTPPMERWELMWAHFRPRAEWIDWLDWPALAPGLMRLHIADPQHRSWLVEEFGAMQEATRRAMGRRETLAMNVLERVLLWCDELNPRSSFARIDPRVRGVIDYVCRSFSRPIGMEDLAEQAGLSVSRICHLFREQVGMAPQQFIEQQRMRRAAELLKFTGRSIQDIATDVGFADPFYFSQRFRRYAGASPRTYRNNHRQRET